jgi:hypothetical protein
MVRWPTGDHCRARWAFAGLVHELAPGPSSDGTASLAMRTGPIGPGNGVCTLPEGGRPVRPPGDGVSVLE